MLSFGAITLYYAHMEYGEKDERFEAEKLRIAKLLHAHGIDTASWGEGGAKTLDHLVVEVLAGECQLVAHEEGLVREVAIAEAVITHELPDGTVLQLYEQKQVFSDGRERRRHDLEDVSISEKLSVGEDSLQGVRRGMQEELQVGEGLTVVGRGNLQEIERDSPSFPGLKSLYSVVTFSVTCSPAAYRPEGYREIQEDKTTYFAWKQLKSSAN